MIALGADVDADAAKATYEDGMLTVELPIVAPAGSRTRPDPPRGRRVVIEIATPGAGGEEIAMGAPPELPAAAAGPAAARHGHVPRHADAAGGRPGALDPAVNDVLGGDRMLALVASRNPELDAPGARRSSTRSASSGTIARMLKVPDGTLRILVQAGPRVRITRLRRRAALPRRARRAERPTCSTRGRS